MYAPDESKQGRGGTYARPPLNQPLIKFKIVCFCPWWKKLLWWALRADAKTSLCFRYNQVFCPSSSLLCLRGRRSFWRDNAHDENESAPGEKKILDTRLHLNWYLILICSFISALLLNPLFLLKRCFISVFLFMTEYLSNVFIFYYSFYLVMINYCKIYTIRFTTYNIFFICFNIL